MAGLKCASHLPEGLDKVVPASETKGRMFHIILNFHGVGPVLRDIDDAERDCWLPQDQFEAVLDLIQGREHVQITFDDGNTSDVDLALPALRRRGLTAAFFVCSGRLAQPTFLNGEQVRQLQSQGMRIGSHGVAHRSWRGLDPGLLRDELLTSRRTLEELCGVPVDTAACPFGEYDRTVLGALRAADYQRVYTSDDGAVAGKCWLQARNTVVRSTPLSEIERLLQAGPGFIQQRLIHVRQFLKRHR